MDAVVERVEVADGLPDGIKKKLRSVEVGPQEVVSMP